MECSFTKAKKLMCKQVCYLETVMDNGFLKKHSLFVSHKQKPLGDSVPADPVPKAEL